MQCNLNTLLLIHGGNRPGGNLRSKPIVDKAPKQKERKDYGIGTLHYIWPMSAHASQAFSTYTLARDCTDSEHLPKELNKVS